MADQHISFSHTSVLAVGAEGQPGERTFYILAADERLVLRILVEKEQVQMLILAVEHLLAVLPGVEETKAEEPAATPNLSPNVEFRAGRLALGYDRERQMLALHAYAADAEENAEPIASCWATPAQMRALSAQGEAVIAAGRPICPLCHQAINPEGHVCPRRNGHGLVDLQAEGG